MKKARLIKKTELAEQAPPRQQPKPLTTLTKKSVQQWIDARQHPRSQNPHMAFAALFTAKA